MGHVRSRSGKPLALDMASLFPFLPALPPPCDDNLLLDLVAVSQEETAAPAPAPAALAFGVQICRCGNQTQNQTGVCFVCHDEEAPAPPPSQVSLWLGHSISLLLPSRPTFPL